MDHYQEWRQAHGLQPSPAFESLVRRWVVQVREAAVFPAIALVVERE